MASGKAVLGSLLGRLIFTTARVSEVEPLSTNFRRVVLEGKELCGSNWTPGDKLQVFLGGELRTYTPVQWDRAGGVTSLVLYVHGEAPGARWAKTVAAGDSVQFFGPRKSLKLAETSGRQVLFGDETSFGLAASLWTLRQGRDVELVFEVSDAAESGAVLSKLGLTAKLVEREVGEEHLPALTEHLQSAQQSGAAPIFSGRAQAIQSLQRTLGRSFRGPTKAYWSLGKRGLD
jgi:NADPH-dependent ferric siderophore reductase